MEESNNSGLTASDNSRFTSQSQTLEDRLKADTVGLVQLSDFRKRRAEALEAAQDGSGSNSRASTPDTRDSDPAAAIKKRKKGIKKGGLSFGDGGDVDDDEGGTNLATAVKGPRSKFPETDREAQPDGVGTAFKKKRALGPNAAVAFQPKAMTKSALLRETQVKDALRKEYLQIQEAVKATEFMIPFVFYDGKNQPGGTCRMKKGDFIWLFLDQARKVGAGLGGKGDRSRKDWARIGLDDLMLVKGDLIIPQHYDFYHFIVNHTQGYNGPLFSYDAEPTATTPQHLLPSNAAGEESIKGPEEPSNHLLTAAQRKQQALAKSGPADSELEGFNTDPSLTKVVDRRWYERNKHIFPASSWEEFDANKDYSSGVRKDNQGNAMFFSR